MTTPHIQQLQGEITQLEVLLNEKKQSLVRLQEEAVAARTTLRAIPIASKYTMSVKDKIALFRSLFRGREDVYAKRYESKKTGQSGYLPACQNEWVQGVCEKAITKKKNACAVCQSRIFIPVSDELVEYHLSGFLPNDSYKLPFVMGVYPLLKDETCWFLALDFDKQTWRQDAQMFMETCRAENFPASLERSRSGNGAHIWLFFECPIPAAKARTLGSVLMTKTLDRRPEIGLDSFDRFFPNQDTLPKGGFGNLIALPLQKAARAQHNTEFLDERFTPYPDQWTYLISIKRIAEEKLDAIIATAVKRNEVLPVAFTSLESNSVEDKKLWERKDADLPAITEKLPAEIDVILSDQLYINHIGLPPILRNRILRLASFSNPEFYQQQAMRLPTWNKPRILWCYEFFPEYIGLPVACLDGLKNILEFYHIIPHIQDEQNHGKSIEVVFHGELYAGQKKAVNALLPFTDGILSATTAFGKTIVALYLIVERKVNTLILVHRKQLLDQWAARIEQFLGIPKKEIGCFSGAKKKLTGAVDIAVMQSVSKQGVVAEWVKDYGQIIVDECHHISASSFERIVRKCPARYRLGLSATVTRKDGQHPIVLMNMGAIRYVARQKPDMVSRVLIPHQTMFQLPITVDPPAIQDVFRLLIDDEQRNAQIIEDMLSAYAEGREILVLSERVRHLALLYEKLRNKTEHLFILKGGLGKKQLSAIMDEISAVPVGANRIILATGKYLGEGFDLPCLDTLFLVFPFSWKGTLTQYAGRLGRTYTGKTEIRIYDYVDDKVPMLKRMYTKRVKGYKALGFGSG
jgi:superfamily II DNA or RNA helicase